MTPERAKYLVGYCHDRQIEINAQIKCGKLISNLETTVHLYAILEEILQHVERQSTSVPPSTT